MGVREVGDVEHVVDHAGGRALPGLHGGVESGEGLVRVRSQVRDRLRRFARTQPDEPIALLHRHGRQMGCRSDGSVGARRRDADAATLGPERPAVIRAGETPGVDGPERESSFAVGAAVRGRDQLTVGAAPDHEVGVADGHADRFSVDRVGGGDDEPASVECRAGDHRRGLKAADRVALVRVPTARGRVGRRRVVCGMV